MAEDDDTRMPAKVPKFFSLIMLSTGIFLYIAWVGADPGTYGDIGLISVSMMFIASGLVGFWHYSNMEAEEAQDD